MSNKIRFNTSLQQGEIGGGTSAPLNQIPQGPHGMQPGFASMPHSVQIVGSPITANIVRMPVGAIRRGNRF